MKRIVIVCGFIAGAIVTAMMIASTIHCYTTQNFEGSMLLGYATMVLAFSMIFVGVKNFRDKYNQGYVTFGTAFKIGLYITLVASTMYVVAWLFEYYLFVPDFMVKYSSHMIDQIRLNGGTQEEIREETEKMAGWIEMYKNPLVVVLMSYSEIVPIGVVVSLISAFVLKRKAAEVF